MQVSELFQQLASGELCNLSIASESTGDIVTEKKPKILRYVNQALLRLYSRFPIKQDSVLLQTEAWLRHYPLEVEHALTSPAVAGVVRFIQDSSIKPFLGDVIKVLSVHDQTGAERPLNDPEDPRSLFTPQPTVIQVPNPISGGLIGVLYQARHPELVVGSWSAKITLPDVLEDALRARVAYHVYSHMNGQENAAKAAEFMAIFDGVCAEVTEQDLVSSSIAQSNTRFAKGGWV